MTATIETRLLTLSGCAALAAALMIGTALVTPFSARATEAAVSAATISFERDWVVTPQAARDLIAQGALVFDARAPDLKRQTPLANAVPIVWQDLSEPDLPTRGRLIADDAVLTKKLQALGVSKDLPVVLVGDPVKGWGEDGRLVWTLRTLGHPNVVLVNGGLPALLHAGPVAIKPAAAGTFVVQRTDKWEIKKEEIKAHLGESDVVIIDAREPREYEGSTPYGETRGGHVPGAKHVFYKDLLDKNGNLLPPTDIEAKLASFGASKDSKIVAYCTGGIRSGWFTSVLNDLGYKARNYAGSMWEWSAQPASEYPLVKN